MPSHHEIAEARRRPAVPTAANIARRRERGELAGAAAIAPLGEDDTPESASRPKATSLADWKRSSGFFSRQCRTMRSIAGETARLVSLRSGGSSFRMELMVSAGVAPTKARLPENIS